MRREKRARDMRRIKRGCRRNEEEIEKAKRIQTEENL